VPRCGGERALTKQAPDENALRCHVALEEANKVASSVAGLLEKNAFVIPDGHIDFGEEVKPKVRLAKAKMNSRRNRLGKITQKLYDLEPHGKPEKALNIDLDLYQMENF
jgi:hypothetical protein